jgi:hypothetical protein
LPAKVRVFIDFMVEQFKLNDIENKWRWGKKAFNLK